jgi:hypothetical protein
MERPVPESDRISHVQCPIIRYPQGKTHGHLEESSFYLSLIRKEDWRPEFETEGDAAPEWVSDHSVEELGVHQQEVPGNFFEEPGLGSNKVQETYTTQMMDSDVILAILPEHMDQIVSKEKNHDFRKYRLSQNTSRIWFYVTEPVNTIKYMGITSAPKQPGETLQLPGLGNQEFDREQRKSKFRHSMLELYELPVTIWVGIEAEESWQFKGPLYPSQAMIKDWKAVDLIRVY